MPSAPGKLCLAKLFTAAVLLGSFHPHIVLYRALQVSLKPWTEGRLEFVGQFALESINYYRNQDELVQFHLLWFFIIPIKNRVNLIFFNRDCSRRKKKRVGFSPSSSHFARLLIFTPSISRLDKAFSLFSSI